MLGALGQSGDHCINTMSCVDDVVQRECKLYCLKKRPSGLPHSIVRNDNEGLVILLLSFYRHVFVLSISTSDTRRNYV